MFKSIISSLKDEKTAYTTRQSYAMRLQCIYARYDIQDVKAQNYLYLDNLIYALPQNKRMQVRRD